MNDQSHHLARLLSFAGQVGSAIRLHAATNPKCTDPDVRVAQSMMALSDTLVAFELLGEYLIAGDSEKAAGYCDRISKTLEGVSEHAFFERNPSIDLTGAIDNLAGLKASLGHSAEVGEGRTRILVSVTSVKCTVCGSAQDGFLNDPRGGTFDCDSCGGAFHVAADAPISFS